MELKGIDILNSGYIPQDAKSTDYLYSAIYEAIELPKRCLAVKLPGDFQGQAGYCWAFAAINTRDRQETVDEKEKYSKEYTIRKTKVSYGNPNAQGESADNVCKTIVDYGTMLAEDLPYTATFPVLPVTPEMDGKAKLHKPKSYVKLDSLQAMKQAIVTHQAFMLGVLVMDSWYTCNVPDKNGKYVIEMPWGKYLGAHLMCLDGYDDEIKLYDKKGREYIGGFRVANSWSHFGDEEGYAWMPYQWINTRTDVGMKYWDAGWTFIDKIENPTGATLRKVQFKVGSIDYTSNGYSAQMDTAPVIRDARTLIPVRFLVEALGLNVYWDDVNRIVSIYDNKTTIRMIIDSKDVEVNGKIVQMDVPAQIINDRTHIPLRFVSEIFGCTVNWDGSDDIITVTK